MKTIIVQVPDKDETLFSALLNKLGFKSRVVAEKDKEEEALAKWIDEGWDSEEVSEEAVLSTLRRYGVKV